MDSSPMAPKKSRRKRNRYTPEFKQRAVALVQRNPDKTLKEIAIELGVSRYALGDWVRRSESEHGTVAPPGETPEQELKRLRKEVERLREEREILKKAATFFAKETE